MKFGEVGLEIIEVCRVAASVVSEVFDDVLSDSTLVNPVIENLNVFRFEALQSLHRLKHGAVAAHVVQSLKVILAHVVLFDSDPEQRADGGRLISQLVAMGIVEALVVGIGQDVLNRGDGHERVVQ